MTCTCDGLAVGPAVIQPGLDSLPLQTRGFAEIRAALLSAISTTGQPWLAGWRGRDPRDFGAMLLDFWAYVGDVLAFYDQIRADELFLRTAKLRPSLRRLVDLIGYRPRPAVGASAHVALLVDGRRPVVLPATTGLRSAAFGAEPPQVFETGPATIVHPDANRWPVLPPRAATLIGQVASLFVAAGTSRVRIGDRLRIVLGPQVFARVATSVTPRTDLDGMRWNELGLDTPVALATPAPVAGSYVEVPGLTASLWRLPHASGDPDVISGNKLVLDGLHRQIVPGAPVLVSYQDRVRWFTVRDRAEPLLTIATPPKITIAGQDVTFPPIRMPVTQIELDVSLDDPSRRGADTTWADKSVTQILVHFGLVRAAEIGAVAKPTLGPGDDIFVAGTVVAPGGAPDPTTFAFASADQRGAVAGGHLDFPTGKLTLDADATWAPELELPVTAYGNVVAVTRGETVAHEVLGSGDRNASGQRFKLKNRPLTYLPDASTESGVRSTLTVFVDGIRWDEVPSFYGVGSDAQVFVVRQDDAGDSWVGFGDGVRGARVPSGVDNVVASYRFGAGAAMPPAGSIAQLAKPIPGLRSALNPVAAAGGEDAEPARSIRKLAPRSALLLGRAISLVDFEAAAAAVPGARAAVAEWRWSHRAQVPLVHIYYIGGAELQAVVSQRLRGLAEPTMQFQVERATPVPTYAYIDVEIDPRRTPADVAAAVRAELLDPDRGMLTPELIGIGAPLFRSKLFEAVQQVPGVLGVRFVWWRGWHFTDYAVTPGSGRYFDLESGALYVHATPSTHV